VNSRDSQSTRGKSTRGNSIRRQRRVLILGEFPECNGGENSLLAILPDLQSRGWQFDLLAPAGPIVDRFRALGCVHHVAHWQSDGRTRPLDERRRILSSAVQTMAPSIVHANSLSMARLAGPVCRDSNVPSVGYLRDIIGVSRQVAQDIGQNERLIAVSNATRRFHVNQGVPAAKIRVVYNGIQPVAVPRDVLGYEPGNEFVIGGVGQIGIRKGWDRFVEAAEIVTQRRPDVRWLIAGTRHSDKLETIQWEQRLRELTQSTALRDRFCWLGRVEDMDAFYKQLDVLVHPARQEPLGRTLLEAGVRGLPIVATDVGGTREIFPLASHSALICPADNASALATAVLRVGDNPMAAANMGQRARSRIEAVFNVARCAEQVDDIYRQLVASQ
jgi:glycosyltransferase involved in cell wall biosynthesis